MHRTSELTHAARILIVATVLMFTAGATLRAAAPEITGVSPSRGPTTGGTTVVISGSGFTGATAVVFGDVDATSFVVANDTAIVADAPPGAVGLVDVVVTTPEGTAVFEDGYGYGTLAVAVNDTYNTTFNTMLVIDTPGVLLNDDPSGGGGVVAELGTGVSHGTLNFTVDGGFTYTPDTNFVGTDTFTYRTQNATGFSNYATVTIQVVAPNIPLPPTNLQATLVRGNQLTLRWTPPAVGLTPTGFLVEGGIAPGQVLETIATGPQPIITIDAPSGAFYIRVRTQAGSLTSDPSNEILVFVNVPSAPSSPDNLLALVTGSSLTLTWRNTFAGGEPTNIVLNVSGSLVASLPLGLTETASFVGVPPGTYSLSVHAQNAAGASFPSTPVTVTVPDPCSGAPLTPANVLAYNVGSTIHVLWDPPASGPAPTSYVLNVGGAFVGSFNTQSRQMSGNVGPGTYTFSVIAVNACGGSAPSAEQTVVVP